MSVYKRLMWSCPSYLTTSSRKNFTLLNLQEARNERIAVIKINLFNRGINVVWSEKHVCVDAAVSMCLYPGNNSKYSLSGKLLPFLFWKSIVKPDGREETPGGTLRSERLSSVCTLYSNYTCLSELFVPCDGADAPISVPENQERLWPLLCNSTNIPHRRNI